jgi:hypothetical protein
LYYQEFTESWFGEDYDKAVVKLWFREMLEPTGEGQHYLESQIAPKHRFLQSCIARVLNCDDNDEAAQALTQFVVSLGTHLITCEDVWLLHSPSLIATQEKRNALRKRMVQAAMDMIEAESQRRQKRVKDSAL